MSLKKFPSLKFSLKGWGDDQTISKCQTGNIDRIWSKVVRGKFQKAYLKVSYGKGLTNLGCIEEISNEGIYDSREDLSQALKAFTEEDLLNDTKKWIGERR